MDWTPPHLDPQRELRELLTTDAWRIAVDAICARHGLGTSAARPYASGSDVVWQAGEHVVKLTTPSFDWQIDAEAHWLKFVGGRLSVATPDLVARGELSGWPFVVMRRVPGIAIGEAWPQLDRAERTRIAESLGELMRELHALDVSGEQDSWTTFWDECLANRVRRGREDGVPDVLADEVAPFLEAIGPLANARHVLLHTELLDQHFFVENRAGRFEPSALIDFADSRVGPTDYDVPALVEFVLRGEPGLLRALLSAYGHAPAELTPERSEVLLAWGLCHRYGSLARMLKSVEPERPRTLSALAQLLYVLR